MSVEYLVRLKCDFEGCNFSADKWIGGRGASLAPVFVNAKGFTELLNTDGWNVKDAKEFICPLHSQNGSL